MNLFRCDQCGRFIPYQDIDEGSARISLIYPDSAYTSETYETLCRMCTKNNKEANWQKQ